MTSLGQVCKGAVALRLSMDLRDRSSSCLVFAASQVGTLDRSRRPCLLLAFLWGP
jgi:hypothetical protein